MTPGPAQASRGGNADRDRDRERADPIEVLADEEKRAEVAAVDLAKIRPGMAARVTPSGGAPGGMRDTYRCW